MILSDLSVTRPVLATVMSLLLVAIGLVAFDRLPLREYPDIDPPVVSIDTVYPGAAANVVETRITQLIEDRVSGVEGIRTIESVSEDGRSRITIEFDIDLTYTRRRFPELIREGEPSPIFKEIGEGTEGVEQTIRSCELAQAITEGAEPSDGIVLEACKTRGDLLNPARFFGGALKMVPNMLRVAKDINGFLDMKKTETYYATEYRLRS